MSDKYFIPTIEEFYIGYQYEFRPWDWNNNKFLEEWKTRQHKEHVSLTAIRNKYIATGNLRVKYLDREDIEIEGWVPYSPQPHYAQKFYINREVNNVKVRITLTLFNDYEYVQITRRLLEFLPGLEDLGNLGSEAITLYEGGIKSINELRKILQYLNIE